MSKKSVLESMRVSKPCNEEWDQMSGNDKARFCSHCVKSVNNVSAMTPKEAVKVVRQAKGSICIRYYVDPVTRKPLFIDDLIQISRRAPRLAAGVMSASISLAAMTYSQTRVPRQTEAPVIEQTVNEEPPQGVIDDGPIIKEPAGFIATGGLMIMRPEHKGLLARAVATDDVSEVRDLISRGEDVNGREDDRTTPLFVAVENGNIEIVELLLNFGAKINARSDQRETVLMKLDEDGTKDLVELLIRSGAKVNERDASGNTALILASQASKPDVVKALIDAGADVNAKNDAGQTPLLNAAYTDDVEVVKLLLAAGADISEKNAQGQTAYDITADREIEDLLVSYGAVPHDKTSDESVGEKIDIN